MTKPRHILVFRFSALGDVAMTVPVLRLLLAQYPDLQVTMVSEPWMSPLFKEIERLHFIGASTKKDYRGLAGLWRLAKRIRKTADFDAIADLHNVLRTQILRTFLWTPRTKLINKGRAEKKSMTRRHNKLLRPLPSVFQRYADVFAALGYPVVLTARPGMSKKTLDYQWLPYHRSDETLIGVAPFARHQPKMYPIEKTRELAFQLASVPNQRVILLGSAAEANEMKDWANEQQNIVLMAGKLPFSKELEMISSLDLVVSMDSANMHLASLFGVPVISIWGGTHPWLGFYGWGQPPENAIQDDLPCRPSSVFGNKPCPVHGEAGCMQQIEVQQVLDRCNELIRSLPGKTE